MRFPWRSRPTGSHPRVERIVLDPAAESDILRGVLSTLTLEQLTAGWLSSDAALTVARDDSRRDQLLRLRGLVLDQLEERFPNAYGQWLRLGGPAHRSATPRR